jgi:hypothetical protein
MPIRVTARRKGTICCYKQRRKTESMQKLVHDVTAKYGVGTTTIHDLKKQINKCYLSEIQKILNSEPHLASKVTDNELWICTLNK